MLRKNLKIMKVSFLAQTLLMLFVLASCQETHFKEDKVFAGGVLATKESLNRGKSLYTEYCMACHGVKGDGAGVASKGLYPPPRNFTLGVYKFGHVVSGELPHDEDFKILLKNGLHGTAMLPWDLREQQLIDVIQYIKTFAPKTWEGKDKALGMRIVPTKDPYAEVHVASAVQRGKEVYHTIAQCWTCHRSYASHSEMSQFNQKINGEPLTDFDPDMYKVKPQPSEHGTPMIPPDFTWDFVRSAKTPEELYIRLNAGVGGTSMPSWKGTLQDDEIWAVAYYVKSLMDIRGNLTERKKLLDSIKN
jgi:mono/diheme cytochrome c family protein